MGGEKVTPIIKYHAFSGSPPRGRGKGTDLSKIETATRITPAWAGKSLLRLVRMLKSEDHPRVGGEKKFNNVEMLKTMGSPPRGRGKEPERFFGLVSHRITPAWAGKRASNL